MSEKNSTSLPLKVLLWRHFNWHLWVGLAIWNVCAGTTLFYLYWQQREQVFQEPFYAGHLEDALSNVAVEYIENSLLLSLFAFIIAFVGGCFRYPFLAALSRKAHTRTRFVVKSLLIFELSVVLLSLPPWPIAYNSFGIESISRQVLVLSLFSLPWLVATGLASRRLAVSLFFD
jgi:hypothetical protein